MPTYQCVSCGGIYDSVQRDGSVYFHVCPTERIKTRAVFDITGATLVTPEAREPMPNPRNENVRPDLVYIEGKPKIVARDPTDATRRTYTDADSFIIAEGAGRAPYDKAAKLAGAPILGVTLPGT